MQARLSRELLNSASQESNVEKTAHRETREALDASEQSVLFFLLHFSSPEHFLLQIVFDMTVAQTFKYLANGFKTRACEDNLYVFINDLRF